MLISKQQAIRVFGSGANLGRAIGITRSAISQWPDRLDQRQTDLVIGAALRLGKLLPESYEILIKLSQVSNARPSTHRARPN
ncbi:Cro/CI family transcriptional regulator [Mycoavidus cysteinexigens]|uniref:Cro/CI family transcriptional regulator n=1 Tax=Mycoavidus cysteinexigens TaxID=1553431 RepID=UPI0009DDF11B|nr:Cro/CI family transcriptional regulator [Mycoavidus cysteinexigens]